MLKHLNSVENVIFRLRYAVPSLGALCEVIPHSAQDAARSWRLVCPTRLAFCRTCVLRVAFDAVQAAELAAHIG
jgi:hypothetical protein